jgi:hypothetical protein
MRLVCDSFSVRYDGTSGSPQVTLTALTRPYMYTAKVVLAEPTPDSWDAFVDAIKCGGDHLLEFPKSDTRVRLRGHPENAITISSGLQGPLNARTTMTFPKADAAPFFEAAAAILHRIPAPAASKNGAVGPKRLRRRASGAAGLYGLMSRRPPRPYA